MWLTHTAYMFWVVSIGRTHEVNDLFPQGNISNCYPDSVVKCDRWSFVACIARHSPESRIKRGTFVFYVGLDRTVRIRLFILRAIGRIWKRSISFNHCS